MQEGKTLNRIRDARKAIETAQKAMDKANSGLAGVESVAEKTDQVRRHPLGTTAVLLGVAIAAFLTVMGMRNSEQT